MTVKDNILFGLDVKKVPKDEQKRRLDEAAEMLGLTPYLKRKPREPVRCYNSQALRREPYKLHRCRCGGIGRRVWFRSI